MFSDGCDDCESLASLAFRFSGGRMSRGERAPSSDSRVGVAGSVLIFRWVALGEVGEGACRSEWLY